MGKRVWFWMGIVVLIMTKSIWAEEEIVKFDLGEVVVTATRRETTIGEVPASVTVITRKEIEKSTAMTADELLREVAGVDVDHGMGIVTVGGGNRVTLRGMGGPSEGRTLILKDGVPMNGV